MTLLFDFSLALCLDVPPEIVVFSRHCSSDLRDGNLKSSPKIKFFKNWIHPAINNAISSIELTCMMPVMFLMTQDQSS
jgi:hypothetical protein